MPSSTTSTTTSSPSTASTTSTLPTPTGRIFLIRHCQSIHNSTRNFSLPDPGLSAHGEAQASSLYFPHTSTIGLIISSPLKRAIQTTLLGFRHVLDERYYAPQKRAKSAGMRGRFDAVRGGRGVKEGKKIGREMQHTLRKLVCTPSTSGSDALYTANDPASRFLPVEETTLGQQMYHAGAIVPAGVENGIPLALEVDLQERSDAPCATGSSRSRLEGEFPTLDFSNLGRRWNRKRGGQAASPEAIKERAARIKRKLHQQLMELEEVEVGRKVLRDVGFGLHEPGEGVGRKDIAVVSHNVFMKVMLWDKDFRLGNGEYLCCRMVGDEDSLGGLKLVPVDEVTDERLDLSVYCGDRGRRSRRVDRSDGDAGGSALKVGDSERTNAERRYEERNVEDSERTNAEKRYEERRNGLTGGRVRVERSVVDETRSEGGGGQRFRRGDVSTLVVSEA